MISTIASSLGGLLFAGTAIYVALMDLTTMTIRNTVVVVLLIAYAVLAPLSGIPLQDIALSTAMAVGTLVIGIACFACGWIGGGDAKLAAVAALWFGLSHTFDFLLCTALFGGGLTLLILFFRTLIMPASLAATPWIQRLHARDGGIPYGVAMAAAVLVILPKTHWAFTAF